MAQSLTLQRPLYRGLKVLTNEKRGGLNFHSVGLYLSYSLWNFQTNQFRPQPVRGQKLLREPCFYYLQTIIVFQYRHSVGLRHTFHIIHLLETMVLYILSDIWDNGKNRPSTIKLFKKRDNSLRYLELRQKTNSDVLLTTTQVSRIFNKPPTLYRY